MTATATPDALTGRNTAATQNWRILIIDDEPGIRRSLCAYLEEQGYPVDEAADAVGLFANLKLPDFDIDDPIDAGALVELDLDGESTHFLLVPAAGGVSIEDEGREITLLTPASGLYQKLLGRKVGDSIDDPDAFITEIA